MPAVSNEKEGRCVNFYKAKNPVQAFRVVSVDVKRTGTSSANVQITLDDGRVIGHGEGLSFRNNYFVQPGDYFWRKDYSPSQSSWEFSMPEEFEAMFSAIPSTTKANK